MNNINYLELGLMIMNDGVVIKDDKRIGKLCNFCCGVDFKPDNSNALFSILKLRIGNPKVIDCISEIIQLPLSKLSGHYNYHHSDNRKQSFKEIKQRFEKIVNEQSTNSAQTN